MTESFLNGRNQGGRPIVCILDKRSACTPFQIINGPPQQLISMPHMTLMRVRMLLLVTALGLAGCSGAPQQSTSSVNYDVSFPNLDQHQARITAQFNGVPAGYELELRMSRTSPGRYALHDFARHVMDLRVQDGSGNSLQVTRPTPHQWNVAGHNGTVVVTYTLFGDNADGTFNGFDRTFAHMNGPATWLWARDQGDAPVSATFDIPDSSWDVATQLFPTEDSSTWTAPNLYYLLDSPVRIAPIDWHSIERGDQTIRIALQHDGTDEQADVWAENVWKIVDAQTRVFGELPRYDGGTYTFLSTYLPNVFRDGMEHRNSTVVNSTNPLSDDGTDNLGTMSHEYFHQWNVERIRPNTLEPFDFEAANLSDALWLAEGFTSYYTGLSIRRAGITTTEDYAHSLSGTLNTVINAPGRTHASAAEMSQWATFSDRGVFGDRMNTSNTFISYYTWGSAIGLGLDLTLRTRFDSSLDAFMRQLWVKHGKEEIPYTLSDVEAELASHTADEAFAADFFDRYVLGRDVMDYEPLLSEAGFVLQLAHPGEVDQAVRVEDHDDGVRITSAPAEGTSWYAAGLDSGDVISRINGRWMSSAEGFSSMLENASPGDEWLIQAISRDVDIEVTVSLQEDRRLEVVLVEENGGAPSDEALVLRAAWMWQK